MLGSLKNNRYLVICSRIWFNFLFFFAYNRSEQSPFRHPRTHCFLSIFSFWVVIVHLACARATTVQYLKPNKLTELTPHLRAKSIINNLNFPGVEWIIRISKIIPYIFSINPEQLIQISSLKFAEKINHCNGFLLW